MSCSHCGYDEEVLRNSLEESVKSTGSSQRLSSFLSWKQIQEIDPHFCLDNCQLKWQKVMNQIEKKIRRGEFN